MLTPIVPLHAVTGRADPVGLELRQNQTLAAQVLRVSADNVVLALQGVRVVARLTEAVPAGWLTQNQTALFQVQSVSGQEIALRVLRPITPAAADESPALTAETVLRLLHQAGAAPTAGNLQLAQALLRQSLAVTTPALAALQQALGGLGPWDDAQVDLAAALRAAGLPLTPETLALAQNRPSAVLHSLPALWQALAQLITQPLPAPLAEAASRALQTLAQMHIDWSAPPARLAEQLETATRLLLHSVEHALARQAEASTADQPPAGLWALARLRTELVRGGVPGSHPVLEAVDQVLAAVSLTQLANAGKPAAGDASRWLVVPMALHGGPADQANPTGEAAAHLRVAYQDAGDAPGIDLGHTRLRLQIDLPEGEAILVDLSMAGQVMGAHVIVPAGPWPEAAQAELPGLTAGLRTVGFDLRSADVTAGQLSPAGLLALGVPVPEPLAPRRGLDVEA